jgi:hypothetical protein
LPKIIIMNQGTEHTRGYDLTRSEPLRKSVGRCSWFAERGDILISPIPIEAGFLRYLGDTLGFDPGSISVFVQDRLRTDALSLTPDDHGKLQSVMAGSDSWTILPCFWTPDVADFASRLGIGDPIALAFAAQRGPDLFNRKRHFRQFAAGMSLPIPEGAIATSAIEVEKAINRYLPITGTVIVKKDNAAGGIGNITVTNGPVSALPGSRETRPADDVSRLAASLWDELTDAHGRTVIVEAYHSASHCFYFEYFIADDGRARFLCSGDVRFREDANAELVWVGLDLPMELPHFSSANALTFSAQFVALAAQVGCRGHINIDAIVTKEGALLFNESNVRWGGGSSLLSLGERLLGPRFADHHSLAFVRDIKSPPRPEARRILNDSRLHYSPTSKEGVVIMACDEHESGTMECVVIAASRPRARELEGQIRGALR